MIPLLLAALLLTNPLNPTERIVLPQIGIQDELCDTARLTCGAIVLLTDCATETTIAAAAVSVSGAISGAPTYWRLQTTIETDAGTEVHEETANNTVHPIFLTHLDHPQFVHAEIVRFFVQDSQNPTWLEFARAYVTTC